EAAQRQPRSGPDRAPGADQPMDMLSLRSKQNLIALAIVALAGSSALADEPNGGVIFDVNGANKVLYPIALPAAPGADQTARDVNQVESTDLGLAGVFKV